MNLFSMNTYKKNKRMNIKTCMRWSNVHMWCKLGYRMKVDQANNISIASEYPWNVNLLTKICWILKRVSLAFRGILNFNPTILIVTLLTWQLKIFSISQAKIMFHFGFTYRIIRRSCLYLQWIHCWILQNVWR